MRLSLFPFLPGDLVSALEQIGIRTDSDIVFQTSVVDIIRKLPNGVISLHDLKSLIAQVAESTAAHGTRADRLLDWEETQIIQELNLDIRTGVEDLDNLVGGFGVSRVFEISGERASGKTTLAIHLVLRHLVSKSGSGALWMDTTGDFSVDRLAPMIQRLGGDPGLVLEKLQVALAFDTEAAHEVLEALPSVLSQGISEASRIRIVVIDSITPLLGPALSAVSSQGHAMMTTFLRQLRALAQVCGLSILIINDATSVAPAPRNLYSSFSTTVAKPALGPSFSFLTDATIWLSKRKDDSNESGTACVAEVFRIKNARSRKWCIFRITDGLLSEW